MSPRNRNQARQKPNQPSHSISSQHTILFAESSPGIKIWSDFESVTDAANSIILDYENRLKQLNSNLKNINYTLTELWSYIDTIPDIAMLV